MATLTVGANLTPVTNKATIAFSKALTRIIYLLDKQASHGKTLYLDDASHRVFTKATAPATNTSADSPGQNLCLVIDEATDDLYLIHTWSDKDTFVAVKILD